MQWSPSKYFLLCQLTLFSLLQSSIEQHLCRLACLSRGCNEDPEARFLNVRATLTWTLKWIQHFWELILLSYCCTCHCHWLTPLNKECFLIRSILVIYLGKQQHMRISRIFDLYSLQLTFRMTANVKGGPGVGGGLLRTKRDLAWGGPVNTGMGWFEVDEEAANMQPCQHLLCTLYPKPKNFTVLSYLWR